MTNKKLDNKVIKGLNSGNSEIVKEALTTIKNTSAADYIPEVITALRLSDSEQIRILLSSYLNDNKDTAARTHIVNALKDPTNKGIITMLVSASWQSGLSYKDHYILFTDIFIKEEIITSIEAFSVIETIIDELNAEEKDLMKQKLKSSLESMDSMKKSFTMSLIELLNT